MDSIASMKACGLVLALVGTALLAVGLATGQAALWGAAPGMIALGVVLLALSRKRPT